MYSLYLKKQGSRNNYSSWFLFMWQWLERNKDIGIFLLRLFIGARLVYGVQDNIFYWHHMIRFRDFLSQFNFPFPLVCAIVSVYAQFIAGWLIIFGWNIRLAALLMIINFLIAWLVVDRHGTIEAMTPALAILFCSVLFLFQGAGRYLIDRKSKSASGSE